MSDAEILLLQLKQKIMLLHTWSAVEFGIFLLSVQLVSNLTYQKEIVIKIKTRQFMGNIYSSIVSNNSIIFRDEMLDGVGRWLRRH